jgi:membrane protein required for colicin V production
LSAAAIFLVSLIVVSLITMKISDFVMDSPVGVVDRLFGFAFGAARGVLLAVVAVIFFNWLVDDANRPQWVTAAVTYPELSRLGEELLSAIPDDPEAAIRGAFEEEPGGAGRTGGSAGGQAAPTNYDEQQQQQIDQLIDATQGENGGQTTDETTNQGVEN